MADFPDGSTRSHLVGYTVALVLNLFTFSSLINLVVTQLSVYWLVATANEILPKLYAFSMMWTLNARQELRDLPWGNRSTLPYITNRQFEKTVSELIFFWNNQADPAMKVCPEEFKLHPPGNDIRTTTDQHVDVCLFVVCSPY